MSRRQVLAGAGGTGLLAAATVSPAKAATRARRARAGSDGTPEQVHLTWSENPATGVVVSWASPGQARRPRVRIGQRVIPAEPRPYTDGISGETVWTYHARVGGLRPGATYAYAVTADNDSNAADPFSATFRTAPAGRARVPLHQLRRPGHPQHRVGALLRPERLRGRGGGVLPAAVPPAQRRPVLREPEPHGAARGVARLRQQQPDLGGQPAVDAVPGQPRGGVLQRPAGLHLLPGPLHPAGQPGARLRRPLVLLPDRLGAVRLARRRRRGLPGRGRLRGGPGGARSRRRAPATRRSSRARRSTSGATPAGRRPPGWSGRWRLAAGTRRWTGSSSRCTSAPPPPRPPATAPTSASARSGCRCSTGTRWTWCSAATTTTTSGPSRCAAPTPTRAARSPPGRRSTPCGRTR